MKHLLYKVFLTAVLSGPLFAWGSCEAVFDQDGSKVSFFFLAPTTNPDAVALYSAITIPVQIENGKNAKFFNFTDSSGAVSASFTCIDSPLVPTVGSCVAILYPSNGLTMEPTSDTAVYTITGDDAQKLAANFQPAGADGVVFTSSDGRFSISSVADPKGVVSSFTIQYH